ncbi:uncharacterized protein THITE_36647, partial [Thermothielavioides terrestris NRRL 8126]
AILCPYNATINSINVTIISLVLGQEFRYLSIKKVENPPNTKDLNAPILSPNFLFSLDFASILPTILTLKVRAPILLLRNLDLSSRLYNGT